MPFKSKAARAAYMRRYRQQRKPALLPTSRAGKLDPCKPLGVVAAVMATTAPGATVLGICPCGGIIRRGNERDPPFLYCALGGPRISQRGRGF